MSNTDSDYEVDNLNFERDTRRRKSKTPKEPTVPEEVELQEHLAGPFPLNPPSEAPHEPLRAGKDGFAKFDRKRKRAEPYRPPFSSVAKKFSDAPVAVKFGLSFSLIFDLASCALAIAAFFVWTSPSQSFSTLIDHWAEAPISDIQLVQAGANCPASFTPLSGEFFGQSFICDCGADNIKISSCTSADSLCTPLTPAGTFDLPNWRYFKICVERHSAGATVNAWNRRGNCGKAGWKNCTSGDDPICVPETSACPLTHFSIVNGGPSLCPAGTTATPAFPSSSDARYLCKATSGPLPLIDTRISVGGECIVEGSFNPYSKSNPQKGTSPSSVDLSRPPFPCSSSETDTRFLTVDQRLMGSVFLENRDFFEDANIPSDEITYWVNNQYPVFYKFSTRAEIYYDPQCKVSRSTFQTVQENLDKLSTSQAGIPVLNLLVDILVSIPWTIWICTHGYASYHLKSIPFLFKSVLNIVLSSAIVILSCFSFFTIWNLHSDFSSLLQADCSDSPTKDLIKLFSTEVNRIMWMDIFICAWSFVSILSDIRRLIFLPTSQQYRKKEFESSPSQLDLHDAKKINFHATGSSPLDGLNSPSPRNGQGYNELSNTSLTKYTIPELDFPEPKRNPEPKSLYENPY